MQYSRYHLVSARQRGLIIIFLSLLAVPLLVQPSMGLALEY